MPGTCRELERRWMARVGKFETCLFKLSFMYCLLDAAPFPVLAS